MPTAAIIDDVEHLHRPNFALKRFSIPKIAINLPFAIFSAAILISINEASYYESSRATEKNRHAEQTRHSVSHLVLIASLEILARDFQERSAMQINTRLDKVHLLDAEQLTIYRLVQESLTNIAKHAQASMAEIRLLNQPGEILIEVAGGKLMIQSASGKGTRMRAALPKSKSAQVAPKRQPAQHVLHAPQKSA